MDYTLTKFYLPISVLVELDEHLQEVKHSWSVDMNGQRPFGDIKINKLYLIHTLLEQLSTLEKSFNPNVQALFLELKTKIKELYGKVYPLNCST